jgi:hypothetical protein
MRMQRCWWSAVKAYLLLLLCFSVAFAVAAPTTAPPAAENANAATTPVVVRWAEGVPGASSEVQNGTRVESLRNGPILIKISPLTKFGEQYTQTWVGVLNSGPDAVSFEADKASVEVVKPKAKTIAAIPVARTAKAINDAGQSAAQVLDSTNQQGNLGCTPGQLMSGCQPTGSGVSTQAAHDRLVMSKQQSQWAQDHGLSTSTLNPGSGLQGAVFFPREKEKEYIVRIPVGNYIFEFPFRPKDAR